MWTRMRLLALLAALLVVADAVPYSKYGRTCKDIGCRPNEVCVMAEDPCTGQSESCGRYPTCSRSSDSCSSMVCPGGQYCKTENGRPTCVSKDHGTAPAWRQPSSPVRPYAPAPRPTPPTPPPRSSSFGNRNNGISGNRNTIGNGSIWDRLFGGDSDKRTRPSPGYRGGFDVTTSRPATTYPGNKGYYTSHTSRDEKGNRIWTFSG